MSLKRSRLILRFRWYLKLQTKHTTAAAVVVWRLLLLQLLPRLPPPAAVAAIVAAFAAGASVAFPLAAVAVTANIALAAVLVLPFCSFDHLGLTVSAFKHREIVVERHSTVDTGIYMEKKRRRVIPCLSTNPYGGLFGVDAGCGP